jgi:hypothetical protein
MGSSTSLISGLRHSLHEDQLQLTDDLHRLNTRRDELSAEYARIPLTGGGISMRKHKEDLEDQLDQIDRQISLVKLRMKTLGLF